MGFRSVYPNSDSEFRAELRLEEGEPELLSGQVLRLAAAFIFLVLGLEREIKPFVVPKSGVLRHCLLCASGSHSGLASAVCGNTPGLTCGSGQLAACHPSWRSLESTHCPSLLGPADPRSAKPLVPSLALRLATTCVLETCPCIVVAGGVLKHASFQIECRNGPADGVAECTLSVCHFLEGVCDLWGALSSWWHLLI